MRTTIILFLIVGAVFFTACGVSKTGVSKTKESRLVTEYRVLINKSIEMTEKIISGELESDNEEVEKWSNELMNFMKDNHEALQNITETELVELEEIAKEASKRMNVQ